MQGIRTGPNERGESERQEPKVEAPRGEEETQEWG